MYGLADDMMYKAVYGLAHMMSEAVYGVANDMMLNFRHPGYRQKPCQI